jgi:hypothetical protein
VPSPSTRPESAELSRHGVGGRIDRHGHHFRSPNTVTADSRVGQSCFVTQLIYPELHSVVAVGDSVSVRDALAAKDSRGSTGGAGRM